METTERVLVSAARTARAVTRAGARKRRRLDVVLLAAAALLVGGVAMIGAAIGDGERISGLWAGAEVAGDGSARITEVIDYDFGLRRRHGIFRDIPGLGAGAPVGVSSATAPDDTLITGYGPGVRVRVGSPARTISGRHRYRVQYVLGDVAPGGRLAWDAVGTEFGGRHELYEMNYAGNHEDIRIQAMWNARVSGTLDGMIALAEQCLADYDENGWRDPAWLDPDDVSYPAVAGVKRAAE